MVRSRKSFRTQPLFEEARSSNISAAHAIFSKSDSTTFCADSHSHRVQYCQFPQALSRWELGCWWRSDACIQLAFLHLYRPSTCLDEPIYKDTVSDEQMADKQNALGLLHRTHIPLFPPLSVFSVALLVHRAAASPANLPSDFVRDPELGH